MIYLFTALYDEAYPFLQYYKMKKEINSLPFEMYRCEEQQICLTITGTGEITAATFNVSAVRTRIYQLHFVHGNKFPPPLWAGLSVQWDM